MLLRGVVRRWDARGRCFRNHRIEFYTIPASALGPIEAKAVLDFFGVVRHGQPGGDDGVLEDLQPLAMILLLAVVLVADILRGLGGVVDDDGADGGG